MHTKTLHSENGFTLTEVLIAIVVVSIGIMSLYAMQFRTIMGNASARDITFATNLAAEEIEGIIARNIVLNSNNPSLNDTNGDGIAGLDNDTAATADFTFTFPDHEFTIYRNIAINAPFADVMQIRTIVQWRGEGGQTRNVTSDYIKMQQ